jgi:hypothetical protein
VNHAEPVPPQAVSLAREWAALGRLTELQGSVAHRRGTHTLALYLALAAVVTLAGVLWPLPGLVLLSFIVLSALVDMDGGRGWVRGLSIADATHNVIAWPTEGGPGPTLVVTAPLDESVTTGSASTAVLCIPLLLVALAGIGMVLGAFAPDLGTWLIVGASAGLMLGACLALIASAVTRRRVGENPARATLEQAITQLERAPTERLRCVFALVGGGAILHDGIEVFLENHRDALPPGRTRVLVIHPHSQTLGLVPHEGRVRPKAADDMLLTALREQGLENRNATTAAARVLRLGWPAAAMTVGTDQINVGAQAVTRLIHALDAKLPTEAV